MVTRGLEDAQHQDQAAGELAHLLDGPWGIRASRHCDDDGRDGDAENPGTDEFHVPPLLSVTADTADTMATTNSTAQAAVMARIRPKAVPRASIRPVIRLLPEAVVARAAVHFIH